jgi:hypothetical protein
MKTLAFIFAILLCAFSSATAQEKPRVVIGAVGAEPKPGLRKALETQIKAAFVKDGRYIATTREEAVLEQVSKEHVYQRGGAVDDGQIKQEGKQSGARYVCVVEISPLMNSYTLNAQLVDIESADIIGIGSVPSALKSQGDFLAASEALVQQLWGDPDGISRSGYYGSGIFMEELADRPDNQITAELLKILEQKITISDGTCIGGVTATLESIPEPSCSKGMVGVVCKADVSLAITMCKGGGRLVRKGTVIGADKRSVDAAKKQFMRNIEKAEFWDEWVKELEKWGK